MSLSVRLHRILLSVLWVPHTKHSGSVLKISGLKVFSVSCNVEEPIKAVPSFKTTEEEEKAAATAAHRAAAKHIDATSSGGCVTTGMFT